MAKKKCSRDYLMNKMRENAENIMYITQSISAEDIYFNLKQHNYSYIVDLFMNMDNELSAQIDIFVCNMSETTCNLIFQFNPLTSPGEGANIFSYPYLSAVAPAQGESKGLILI